MTTQPEVKTNTPNGLLNEFTDRLNILSSHTTQITGRLYKSIKTKVTPGKNEPFIPMIRILKKLESNFTEFGIKLKEAAMTNSQNFASKLSIALDVTPDLLESSMKYCQRYHKHWKAIAQQRLANKEIEEIITSFEKEKQMSFNTIFVEPLYFINKLDSFLENAIKVCPSSVVENAAMDTCLRFIVSETTRMKIMYPELDEIQAIRDLNAQAEIKLVNEDPRRLFVTFDLTKFSRKTQDPRTIILLSDYLMIGERSGSNKFKNLRSYPKGEFQIVDVPDQNVFKNSVDILTTDKSFRGNMKSSSDKEKLMEAVRNLHSFYYPIYSTIDNDKFAPVWIPDDLVTNCQICNSKFTFINRRHHCRVCGACICSECAKKVSLPQFEGKQEKVCVNCIKKINKTS
ncbi:FYVE zinc finger family protein [Trichomonas vaginalis G3]|uniref:FYVE zinc finger family protein n=1 Tax=Trichomonas vaginalis (strain ATCC PRA-98 / G3) TaxID=412133 RepID=A2DFE9_TRIV3|nr:lipid binding [Trichomonas vaginalis G3]EAY20877.1 FYVE zinc finger family protein [Trichomonas vaginalis G3]KAI5521513.1 lipid binding [Trichomonas vaginalis G3]|eukprot:XP_001581863.1 FYVE zinc finger family protein [Trichomonas vaginalis G3]